MFCHSCGTTLADGAMFCQQCGKQQFAVKAQGPAQPQSSDRSFVTTRTTDQFVSTALPPLAQSPQMTDNMATMTRPLSSNRATEATTFPPSSNGGAFYPPSSLAQPQTSQPAGTTNQIVLVFPKDRPNRIVLGGLAAILLGLFLPWVQVGIPDILGVSFAVSASAISSGLPGWLLVFVLLALGAFVLCQGWLYRNKPGLPHWLLIMPLITGVFIATLSFYTLILILSLQAKLSEISNGLAPNLLSAQFGTYLVLLGGITLTIGGYQKFVYEYGTFQR